MIAILTAPVLVASLVMLSSCIDSAYSLDPSDWYSSAVGVEPAPAPGDVPGFGNDYPELGSVPEEPVNVSSAAEIDQVAESLAADLANAQYTSDIARADDETAPSAIPLPTVTAVEPVETTSLETLVASPTGSQVALTDEITNDTLVIVPAEPTMDVALVVPVESRIETETILDEDGELVGSITTVIVTSLVRGDQNEADMMIAVAAAETIEPVAEPINETLDLPAVSDETLVIVPTPAPESQSVSVAAVPDAPAADDGSTSLVALSERSAEDAIVVVPDYMAAADINTPEPVEPAPAVTAAVVQPSHTTAAVGVISSAGVSFDDLFGASSPDAGAAVQNVAAVGSPTTTINDATFTTAGTGNVAQTLAAIIRFGNGSSSLGADERHIVAQLAAIHAQTGGPMRLVGHASKSGGNLQSTDAVLVNFKISLDRATAVAKELIRNGVPPSDILVEAAAATDSMAADAGLQNEAVDRRVEVFFGV